MDERAWEPQEMKANKGVSVDRDWETQEDARALMRAHEVMSDGKRHGKAKKALDRLHQERQKESMHAKAAKGLKRAFGE
jgi:hypothetical protein